jgi:hypothetical protein
MSRTSGRILKGQDVELQGQYRLEAGQVASSKTVSSPAQTGSAPKQARIIENHPDYVVLEVTCSCGTKMVLRCEYAGDQTPDNYEVESDTQAVSSQKK